ncbi:complement component C1q receptor [Pygocentrus nattereri]|uniref:Thrombomodulin n=1 Tax=Pygocentrus nattereri TaxID=42514 RepID=A0A3B4CFZ7_PYGNA|nr:complement component C1q receptor [Pygocentrus nattereri]
MRALLLALSALVAAWQAAGQAAIWCTERACYTLHDKRTPFEAAYTVCYKNGGYLLTMKDEKEAEDVRIVLELANDAGLFTSGEERLWIGLKLNRSNCVLNGEPLRGFHWVPDTADSGTFTNWGRQPHSTCTEERCVSLQAAAAGSERLRWIDGSCKVGALYACRFQFKGMCKPLTLAGPGEVTYTVHFSNVPLNQSVNRLPHSTHADISCASSGEKHYSFCTDAAAGGGFAWYPAKPFCESGERSCAFQNGGCSHVCSEDRAGDVRCACKEGYHLGKDEFTCIPKNACQNAPCEHECVVEEASFACKCRKGYRLAQNWFGCVDEDECEQGVCGGHTCRNKPGSYECECKKGFRKDDTGACHDIDECAESACREPAGCLNSQGSFSCYCSAGFRQAESGECVDVDECVSRPCEDICTNTEGSYKCSCRENFRLSENGISCVQVIVASPHTTASNDALDRSTAAITVTPLFSSEDSSTASAGTERMESSARSPVLVWVLGSVIPLLLLVALTTVVAVLRCNRARKAAKKKSATADSYCWVSSGFQAQPDTQPR